MKKFLLIILFGILAMSCTLNRTMYGYTITYEIDGVQYTDTDSLECSEGYVPMYVQGKHSISINQADQRTGRGSGYFYTPVYEGPKNCKVNDFDFWPIRTYKVSQIDGHEIKRRK